MIGALNDDVRLGGFTPATTDFLRDLLGVPADVSPLVVTLPEAAALFFVLRALPGSRFPGGKWATIQHLEQLVDQAVGR